MSNTLVPGSRRLSDAEIRLRVGTIIRNHENGQKQRAQRAETRAADEIINAKLREIREAPPVVVASPMRDALLKGLSGKTVRGAKGRFLSVKKAAAK